MFPDNVFMDRYDLCATISALPPDYFKDNAAALLTITSEFQRSFELESRIIQQVKRLDVENCPSVHNFAMSFADYVDQRGFDLERTRYSQIRRVFGAQILTLQGGTQADQDRVKNLRSFLERFTWSDNEFTEEIEPVTNRALCAVKDIDELVRSGQIEEAHQRQNNFICEYELELKRLKSVLKTMNEIERQLIEQL